MPPGFYWGLGTTPHFGRRSDQGSDLALGPGIETGSGIERETSRQPERRPLRTYTGQLRERLGRTGDVVGFDNVIRGLRASQETLGRSFFFWICIHGRPRSMRGQHGFVEDNCRSGTAGRKFPKNIGIGCTESRIKCRKLSQDNPNKLDLSFHAFFDRALYCFAALRRAGFPKYSSVPSPALSSSFLLLT